MTTSIAAIVLVSAVLVVGLAAGYWIGRYTEANRGRVPGRFIVYTDGRCRMFDGMADTCTHNVRLDQPCEKCDGHRGGRDG